MGSLYPDQRVQAVGLTPRRASNETAASCVVLIEDGWNGSTVPELVVVDMVASYLSWVTDRRFSDRQVFDLR